MKSRLLIVDDRPENLVVLTALLGTRYHLVPATSGHEALEKLEAEPVDLILLDVEMPGMDGYEVTRRVKMMPQHEDIPIILISGVFIDDPFIRKGYESGAVDFFTKPFDPNVLRKKVSLYASLRQKDVLIDELRQRVGALEAELEKRHPSRV